VIPAPVPALRPLGRLYGWLARLRREAYEAGLLRPARAALPVVSVGNLTAGGNGKTPMCAFLANALAARGLRPAILSRGYGRARPAPDPLVVSRGDGPLVPAEISGDEPRLLAGLTRAVVVCARRRSAAAEAAAGLGADVLILDDGFQHLALARDLDILRLRSPDPLAGGLVIPAGRLREPAGAHRRADVLVALQSPAPPVEAGPEGPGRGAARPGSPGPGGLFDIEEDAGGVADAEAGDEPARLAGWRPLFRAALVPTGWRPLAGGPLLKPEALAGLPAAAFCGLANPESFRRTLASLGVSPAGFLALPDHARYGGRERGEIRRWAARLGPDYLLTTAKDAVKLSPSFPNPPAPGPRGQASDAPADRAQAPSGQAPSDQAPARPPDQAPSPFGPPVLALETELVLDRPDDLIDLVLAAVRPERPPLAAGLRALDGGRRRRGGPER
jgi:tetraacyldisaccharide 4'-kinase